jgi:Zn-dependent peptidase ImmA (M78 family)
LVTSGYDSQKQGVTEAEQMAEIAKELGVPAEAILLELQVRRGALMFIGKTKCFQ